MMPQFYSNITKAFKPISSNYKDLSHQNCITVSLNSSPSLKACSRKLAFEDESSTRHSTISTTEFTISATAPNTE